MSFSKIVACGLLLFLHLGASAQIGGISRDKLHAYSATSLSKYQLHFEPKLIHNRSAGFYDGNREFRDFINLDISTQLNIRTTLGLTENIEVGAQYSTDLELLRIGAKFHVLRNEDFGVGVLAGYNILMGNKSISHKNLNPSYAIGLASNFQLMNNVSLDASIVAEDTTLKGSKDLFFNVDLGLMFTKNTMAIIGVGYKTINDKTSNLLSIYPGLILKKKSFNFLLQGRFDVAGKSSPQQNGFSFSIIQIFN